MSKMALLIRYIFFCLFFTIGAGSIALSFLAPEILENYKSIDQLHRTEAGNVTLEERIDTYDKQIEMAQDDPDILIRLQQKTFGIRPSQENAAFPEPSKELMQSANKAMKETENSSAAPSKLRKYIEQSADKKIRKGLFYSGAALILIAFICFGAPKRKLANKQNPEPQPQT
jgi:hypothetical protein